MVWEAQNGKGNLSFQFIGAMTSKLTEPKAVGMGSRNSLSELLEIGEPGFPGGAVVKNPPANAGGTGSSPGPGRSHMPRCN